MTFLRLGKALHVLEHYVHSTQEQQIGRRSPLLLEAYAELLMRP